MAPTPRSRFVRGEGIFFESVARLDAIDLCSIDVLRYHTGTNRFRPTSIASPHGPLTRSFGSTEIEVDITEIEGISASKSSDRYFESVRAFGQDFADYLGTAVDPAGLAKMLKHGEIRIIGERRSDSFSLRLWDARLFLANDGGSHHFAAAAYIAGDIGAAVRLRAPLTAHGLNEASVAWLLQSYAPYLVGQSSVANAKAAIAQLAGECGVIDLPGCLAEGAAMLLVPTSARDSREVCCLVEQQGAQPLRQWMEASLNRQRQLRSRVAAQTSRDTGYLAVPAVRRMLA
ncbi:DUF6685 family protein [Cupriavidus sp. D39]|uniref:DUF6685 family protein n=1 Tax=Cupriavidus sp. D39 TaxID=2997877 RepID=UPI00227020D1|nr:DUF6685 family protein [Cupriavidus sp. D39]MCY0852557.1 hypothetical protein [Cupriavidus sp. D39]